MARLKKNEHPGVRLHKATGQAVVTLSGRDYYLGKFGTAEATAKGQRLVGEWLARGRRLAVEDEALEPANGIEPVKADGEYTVVELLAAFRAHAEVYYRKNGRITKEVSAFLSAARVVESMYAEVPVSQFGPLKLAAVQEQMIQLGWARTSINRQRHRIVRAFRWGVSREMLKADVVVALRTVECLSKGRTEAREPEPVLPIDEASIKKTLDHLPRVVADMVKLQRLTGMRPEEVCGIKPGNLERTGKAWRYVPDSHKMEHRGRKRIIFIGPRGQKILQRYLFRDPEVRCFSPAESERARREEATAKRKTPTGYGNRPGTNRKTNPKKQAGAKYTTDSYRRAIERACKAAGIDAWAPNRLRHTAATALRKKYGVNAARQVLGHSEVKTTETYAQIDEEKAAAVMAQVG